MGDRSIAVLYEEKHLAGPRFRRQGPAVAKYNRLSGAPILVVDISSVLCHDSAHCGISFCASCNSEESTRRSKKGSSLRALVDSTETTTLKGNSRKDAGMNAHAIS